MEMGREDYGTGSGSEMVENLIIKLIIDKRCFEEKDSVYTIRFEKILYIICICGAIVN